MELLIFVLLIAVSGLTVVCAKAKQEQKNLEGRLRRYDTLVSKEEFEEELSAKIVRQENELINLEHQREQLSGQVNTLQKRLNEVEEEVFNPSVSIKLDIVLKLQKVINIALIKSEKSRNQ
jgi:predicted nuclease with TOPRIM domain